MRTKATILCANTKTCLTLTGRFSKGIWFDSERVQMMKICSQTRMLTSYKNSVSVGETSQRGGEGGGLLFALSRQNNYRFQQPLNQLPGLSHCSAPLPSPANQTNFSIPEYNGGEKQQLEYYRLNFCDLAWQKTIFH